MSKRAVNCRAIYGDIFRKQTDDENAEMVQKVNIAFDKISKLTLPTRRILCGLVERADGKDFSVKPRDVINHLDISDDRFYEEITILDSKRFVHEGFDDAIEVYCPGLDWNIFPDFRKFSEEKNFPLQKLIVDLDFQLLDEGTGTLPLPITLLDIVGDKSTVMSKDTPQFVVTDNMYQSTLGVIRKCGIEMERHPSTYADKDEEALRDHLLTTLSPQFDGTTGETFNKTGKTDIMIRHGGETLFVAECKFWRGIKVFLATIDQLLGYLTWRDSKVAVIIFVDNKELNPVLDQIVAETPKHPCFIKDGGKKGEGWYQYEFHLKDDPSRGVKLAVLCFHFPKA